MLILIGTAPTDYALNHAVTKKQSQDFIAGSQPAASTLDKYANPSAVIADSREDVTEFVRTREFMANATLALRQLVHDRRGGLVRSSCQYNPCLFLPVSPGPWQPTTLDCKGERFAICAWHGYSPCRSR